MYMVESISQLSTTLWIWKHFANLTLIHKSRSVTHMLYWTKTKQTIKTLQMHKGKKYAGIFPIIQEFHKALEKSQKCRKLRKQLIKYNCQIFVLFIHPSFFKSWTYGLLYMAGLNHGNTMHNWNPDYFTIHRFLFIDPSSFQIFTE